MALELGSSFDDELTKLVAAKIEEEGIEVILESLDYQITLLSERQDREVSTRSVFPQT